MGPGGVPGADAGRGPRRDPQSFASFRWASEFGGEALAPGKTTLVEFTLAETADGVEVTVAETGFATLVATEDVRLHGFAENSKGWVEMLAVLREAES